MKNMKFNFENMSLNTFQIGELVQNYDNEILQDKSAGYSINIKNNRITHITIYFDNGVYGFSKFEGDIRKGSDIVNIHSDTSFYSIKDIFGESCDKWDDGVEMNLQFLLRNYHIEFSWNIESEVPQLMYFCVSRPDVH